MTNAWPETPEEASSMIERGLRYFPDTRPHLFTEVAEWRLYFAMVVCHERQDECLGRGDYLGALKAAAQMVKEGGLV